MNSFRIGRIVMPLIGVQIMEGVFSDDETARIIEKVIVGFGQPAGQALADATSVRAHVIKSGSWGYNGRSMTPANARAMRAKT
jgi:4-oxalocrotonate tautomerase